MSKGVWVPSTVAGFENLVVGHNLGLDLPVFGGWRRLNDPYETVLVKNEDGKSEWAVRPKESN